MLLLKRTGCPTVLSVGSTAGSSWIKVFGADLGQRHAQPAGHHPLRLQRLGCCSNSVFYGKAADGIVAYAAPKIGSPSTAGHHQARPDQLGGRPPGPLVRGQHEQRLRQPLSSPARHQDGVAGRPLVSRSIVDSRYLSGVKSAISGAQSGVFAYQLDVTALGCQRVTVAAAAGRSRLAPLALDRADKLFVDCSATPSRCRHHQRGHRRVHRLGQSLSADDLAAQRQARLHLRGHAGPATSATTRLQHEQQQRPRRRGDRQLQGRQYDPAAVLFVKSGDIKQTGGRCRLCNTTVYMMGGQDDGCVPSYTPATPDDIGPAPTQSPCTSGPGHRADRHDRRKHRLDSAQPVRRDPDGNGDPTRPRRRLDQRRRSRGPGPLGRECGQRTTTRATSSPAVARCTSKASSWCPTPTPIALAGNANFVLKNAQFVATSLALASNNTT